VFTRGRAGLGHLAPHTDGLEVLREAVLAFDPAQLALRADIPRDRIAALAQALLDEPRALVYGRVGACTQEFGGLTLWLINCLNAVTGHLDREGGMMFAEPAIDLTRAYGSRGHYGKFRSRVRGLPEFSNELPVAVLAEEISTPGIGQVRALFTMAGNPVLSTPNGVQLDAALSQLEFMVSIDLYLNETSRHAHLILPPASPLERSHYDIALSGFAVRNVAKYSPPLFVKPADARHDFEILAEIARRVRSRPGAIGARLGLQLKDSVVGRLGPDGMLDWMLKTGRYGVPNAGAIRLLGGLPGFGALGKLLAAPDRQPAGVTLQRLRAEPNGVDLGPLGTAFPRRLATADGRLALAPALFVADLRRAAAALAEPVPELALIGRRHVRSNNSWMHNSQRLVKGKPRCTLLMHPEDAAVRGLHSGEKARVTSRVGCVEVPVEVNADVRRGVVSLPHGWGHGRRGVRLSIAAAHAGVSINDLVDEQRIDALTGTAVLNGTPVTVERCTESGAGEAREKADSRAG
jgi:anaerobic selenocysteine-containing dehydrogenase